MEKVGIFYGSDTGNTEEIAIKLKETFGKKSVELFDVSNSVIENLNQFSNIILGSSTWGLGEMQGDFELFMEEIEKVELKGKKIAIYGLGDSVLYPDTFVDAIGIIYDKIEDKECNIVGFVSVDDYDFKDSMALKNGVFVGLPIDKENESDKTDIRIKSWVNQLCKELY